MHVDALLILGVILFYQISNTAIFMNFFTTYRNKKKIPFYIEPQYCNPFVCFQIICWWYIFCFWPFIVYLKIPKCCTFTLISVFLTLKSLQAIKQFGKKNFVKMWKAFIYIKLQIIYFNHLFFNLSYSKFPQSIF